MESQQDLVDLDIGWKLLTAPFPLAPYEEPEPLTSTGFLSRLKAMKKAPVPAEAKQDDEDEVATQPPDTADEQGGHDTTGDDSDNDEVEELDKPFVEARYSDHSADASDMDLETADESTEDDDAIQHSLINDSFISFSNVDDVAGIAEGSPIFKQDSPKQPVHEGRRTAGWSWKEGLSTREIGNRIEEIVDELSIVRDSPPWQYALNPFNGYREDAGFYVAGNLAQIFQTEVEDAVEYFSPRPLEHAVRQHVLLRITQVIHSLWPKAKAHVFGSFQTRIYLPSSDLDVVIDLKMPSSGFAHHNRLAQALKAAGLAKDVNIIKARVPIVKFIETIAQFSVDISFNMENGPHSAKLIKSLADEHKALKPLTMILKQFLYMRGLNEVFCGGLGSYGITSIIANFLQTHPRIQANEIKEEENLGVLLMEFLDLYGKRFNYDRVGVSLRNGGTYFIKGRLGNLNNTRPSSLTVEDPQDTENDITRGTFNMRTICVAFSHAFDCLASCFYELHARQNSSPVFRVKSILGTIIQVPENIIQHRRHVKEVYESLFGTERPVEISDYQDGLISSHEAAIVGISEDAVKRIRSEYDESQRRKRQKTSPPKPLKKVKKKKPKK